MPILHAPILEQAGFSVGNADPEPVINYVARLDGVSQYWQLSEPIQLVGNYRVEVELESIVTAAQKIFDSQGNDRRFDINLVYTAIELRDYANFEVNGVNTNVIRDINELNLVAVLRDDNTIDRQDREVYFIGCRYSGITLFEGVFKNFKVYDENNTLTHFIPLTNKEQGATQLAAVGSVNAFMPNYTPDVWEVDE